MTNNDDSLTELRATVAELEMLDRLRAQYLRKRDLQILVAFETGEATRMQVAVAAGLTMGRTFGIAAEGRTISSPQSLLDGAAASVQSVLGSDLPSLSVDADSRWLVFPDPEDNQ